MISDDGIYRRCDPNHPAPPPWSCRVESEVEFTPSPESMVAMGSDFPPPQLLTFSKVTGTRFDCNVIIYLKLRSLTRMPLEGWSKVDILATDSTLLHN